MRMSTWTRKIVGVCTAAVAVVMLSMVTPAPAAAADGREDCAACENCEEHENLPCLQCGVLVLYAISGCCGMGDGTAMCTGENFNVTCANGNKCKCNDTGGECEAVLPD